MLARIISWSIDNTFMVMIAMAGVLGGGWWAASEIRLDAIPDLTDTQVIITTEYLGQSPQVVEDQITFPISTRMLGLPRASDVRGFSSFGLSFVFVVFEDGTDRYWARSRVVEALSGLGSALPEGVDPTLGPDASGVGWAFMYAVNSDIRDLADLRSLQDWFIRPGLSAVPGVAEVATFGGFVRQFQVTVDPVQLRRYDVSLERVRRAIRESNMDVGGRVLEQAEREHMIRGIGRIQSIRDLERVVLGIGPGGASVTLADVGTVAMGPAMRRGIGDWNGEGETVGGIVVVRDDADTLEVIGAVKDRLRELQAGIPEDVRIDVGYDRSGLITQAVETLTHTLVVESIIVAVVCVLFLLHLRSALVAIVSIPISILLSLIVMHIQGIGANIMSLGGIAISIGVLVDAAVVMVENAHSRLEDATAPRRSVIQQAAVEVGPTLFFTLLVITVSFLPVFTLQAQEGRLFRPLALTKTYAMAASSLVAITVVPVLMLWFVRGRIVPERRHPISRLTHALYRPLLDGVLSWRWAVVVCAIVAVLSVLWPLQQIGSEFMPPLWEGDLLYMPTTLPGLSITAARDLLQHTDRMIAQIPEVESVLGKIGRAETATDPAPLTMVETTIRLKPRDQWRPGLTQRDLIRTLDAAVSLPGVTNAWIPPIKTRIDMLSTGVRTPVGIKVSGPDLAELERLVREVEAVVRTLPGTRSASADRVMGGSYLEIEVDRDEAARFGLSVAGIQQTLAMAVGGTPVTEVIDGLERIQVELRYPRELRDAPEEIGEVVITTPAGVQIPLGRVTTMRFAIGPTVIKSENARPASWVYVDLETDDLGGWVKRAREVVARSVSMPAGYDLEWVGQYESIVRTRQQLAVVIPLTLGLITMLLYMATRSVVKTVIVVLAVPFSAVGAVWLLWWLGYNWSIAVWVGLIALAGLDAETGVVMLLYLDLAWEKARRAGRMANGADLHAAIRDGALKRLRPKLMTVATTFTALVPILWSTGIGSDVMRRIAAPMVGGIVTSFIGELLVYPALYSIWRHHHFATTTRKELS